MSLSKRKVKFSYLKLTRSDLLYTSFTVHFFFTNYFSTLGNEGKYCAFHCRLDGFLVFGQHWTTYSWVRVSSRRKIQFMRI
jgi:hypothetical protein